MKERCRGLSLIGATLLVACAGAAGCNTVQSVVFQTATPSNAEGEKVPAPLQAPTEPAPAAPSQVGVPSAASSPSTAVAPPVAPAAPPGFAPASPALPGTHPPPSSDTATKPGDAEGAAPVLSQDEALGFYQDVMLTFTFDACGLPLLGAVSREDIVHRIEVCPASPDRKDALRTIFQRAIADAARDPAKTRAGALAFCADKRAFLSNVMHHASELTFDEGAPPNCDLIAPPAAAPQ